MENAEVHPLAPASNLESTAAAAPDSTPEMLNVAKLLLKAEPDLVARFNSIAAGHGLPPERHISDAIGRASSKFISLAERDALESALDQFFAEAAGDKAQQCRQQWPTCDAWMRRHLAIAYPLFFGSPASLAEWLQQLHAEVLQGSAYADVREAATVLAEQFAQSQRISL